MNIGLDFDGTTTLDTFFFSEFIKLAKRCGHRVIIVTFRGNQQDNFDIEGFCADNDIRLIYTDGQQKQSYCDFNNIKIDVWIDDMPILIPSEDAIRLAKL